MPVIHLAPLSNEVVFKKAFSDKEVLSAFVKDAAGVDFVPDTIETEHRFNPPVGGIDIRYDIFAQSEDGRVVVELQRIRYDSHFDRFLNYFCASIVEQGKNSKDYRIPRRVITIVLLTSPYRVKDQSGVLVEDSVLISRVDPRTLKGEERTLFDHQLIFLNPHFSLDDVPSALTEWLKLVKLSLDEPTLADDLDLMTRLGSSNPTLLKAAHLTSWDGMTTQERTAMKDSSQEETTTAEYLIALDVERRQHADERRQKEEERRQKEEALEEKAAALAQNRLLMEKLRAMGIDPDA
jgi:hypothetical protein